MWKWRASAPRSIIANPAGIQVDGGGFINASKATLTTGAPQFNVLGGLDSFVVRGGTITIDGAGLDLSKTDYAAILARATAVNAAIWANRLKVVTGANQISTDHEQVTPDCRQQAASPSLHSTWRHWAGCMQATFFWWGLRRAWGCAVRARSRQLQAA